MPHDSQMPMPIADKYAEEIEALYAEA